MSNPNMPNIMLKLSVDDGFIMSSTYCRRHKRRGRFFISRERVEAVLSGTVGTIYDSDCGHHVSIFNHNNQFHITFDWLSEYSDASLRGIRQRMEVPCEVFSQLLDNGEPIKYLFKPHEPRAKIDASHVGNAIKEISTDLLSRHAFRKAMRDCFHWNDETVTLFNDSDGFLFRTASGCPACGGLIRHTSEIRTPAGLRSKVYYGVHT